MLQLSVQEVAGGAEVAEGGGGGLLVGRQQVDQFVGQLGQAGGVPQTRGARV